MRWLLLEEVLSIQRKVKARTRSRVPFSPVSPEILMVEMMAQTGGLLLGAESDFQDDLIFAKIEKADFAQNTEAGRTIYIEAESENLRPEGAWLDGRILDENEMPIASSRFLLMNVGHLFPERNHSITFHSAFMNYFRVREKVL